MVTANSMRASVKRLGQPTFILSMPCCPVIFSLVSVSHVEESMFWMVISSFLFGLKPDISSARSVIGWDVCPHAAALRCLCPRTCRSTHTRGFCESTTCDR